jgi:hypothetical protein
MKRNGLVLIATIGLSVLLLGCKKNDINPDEVRLLALETTDTSQTYRTVFDYDNLGRIIKVHFESSPPQTVIMNIVYQGNEILITPSPSTSSYASAIDSVILFMDAANRVQKRIAYSFFEIMPPGYPQRTYNCDTSLYQYNAAGLLQKETSNHRDSTWFNQLGDIQTWTNIISKVSDYENTDGNLTSIKSMEYEVTYSHQHGTNYIWKSSIDNITSFEYTKRYPNKTDFSNATVLSELGYLNLQIPLNKNYKNLPDKVTIISTSRDQSGVITFFDNHSFGFSLKYNSYGFLSSTNNGLNGLIYNK